MTQSLKESVMRLFIEQPGYTGSVKYIYIYLPNPLPKRSSQQTQCMEQGNLSEKLILVKKTLLIYRYFCTVLRSILFSYFKSMKMCVSNSGYNSSFDHILSK